MLKPFLMSAPILSYPRLEGEFILDTDANTVGQEKITGFFSKAISKPERNYCVIRK